jgi:hypothetical protein
MQQRGETDSNACAYNDFALLRLDARDHGKVNPTVPHWGGPVALGSSTAPGEEVYSYGNSSLRLGLDLLKPKSGLSLGQSGGGWTHTVYTVTPGVPGTPARPSSTAPATPSAPSRPSPSRPTPARTA